MNRVLLRHAHSGCCTVTLTVGVLPLHHFTKAGGEHKRSRLASNQHIRCSLGQVKEIVSFSSPCMHSLPGVPMLYLRFVSNDVMINILAPDGYFLLLFVFIVNPKYWHGTAVLH